MLDLFSGACGGWSLGLHRAGMRTVAACEWDEWRRRQYARNFPDVRIYDDVRTLTADRLRADGCWPIHVVAGSPPCQDASTANTKGRGIDGERTGLYLEAVRLVREIRPRWAAFENVPGIRNRGIDRVLRELEEAGYAAWPLVVGALDLGAPHIRKRSWVVCADAATVRRLALPWDQSDGSDAGATPVAHEDGELGYAINGEVGECMDASASESDEAEWRAQHQTRDGDGQHGNTQREESAGGLAGGVAPADPDAGTVRQSVLPRRPEPQAAEPQELASANTEESAGRAGPELAQPELEGRIAERLGSIAHTWNGGLAGRVGVDDGLPKGMAQPLLAAYGDSILPQISEIIGRAILQSSPAPSEDMSTER